MTNIERMAKEAGLETWQMHGHRIVWVGSPERLAKFAALVVEDAARICEAQLADGECPERAQYCADAIRAKYPMPALSGGKDAAK